MATPSKIEVHPKYTYNHADDCYVINVKNRVKPLVLKGFKVRAIQMAISNAVTPSETGREICAKYCLSEEDFDEIKKAFGLTRDSFPLTDEELTDSTVEQSADKILEEKRAAVYQAAEKAEWKETQADAEKWRQFQTGELDPFVNILETWNPISVNLQKPAKPTAVGKTGKTLVIGLSDLHFGAASKSRYMFNRPDWTTQDTVDAVSRYCSYIIQKINERKYQFDRIVLVSFGDVLHSVLGKTARGTELKYDCVREEQFEYALSSLQLFIASLYKLNKNIEVHATHGNHNYEGDMAIFKALDKAFSTTPSIKFFHYSSRPAAFKIDSTLFLLDHGGDSVERAYVPTGSDSKIQLHVQSLLLSNPEMLIGVKSKLFCMGHLHHWEHIEYNDFEFIIFGTILGADEHASVQNYKNRARQTCLVLDENGLSETLHFFVE